MQAASLARDFDLAYTQADFDRFVADWGVPPDGPRSSRAATAAAGWSTASRPLYALVTAPFARVAPVRGPVVANALLLAAAALLAARSLRRRIGPAAPLWVAAFLFASVAFAYVFWGDADLFLFAAAAAGFALVYKGDRRHDAGGACRRSTKGRTPSSPRGFLARWLGAGALLAVIVVYRPLYLVLLAAGAAGGLAVAAGAAAARRVAGLVLGAGLLAVLSMGIQWMAGGDCDRLRRPAPGDLRRAGLSGGGLPGRPAGPSR